MNKVIQLLVAFFTLFPILESHAGSPGTDDYSAYLRLANETGGKLDDRHYVLLTKAAEAGHQIAQGTLGVYLLTERGQSDPKALKTAVMWLKKVEAIDKPEFDGAVFMLALCYLQGSGTAEDPERAGKLLERVAERGTEDMKLAYVSYLIAMSRGREEAERYLKEVIRDTKNPDTRTEAEQQLRSLK